MRNVLKFDVYRTPIDGYPIKVTGGDYASIYIPWPYDNPPQSYEMLSMNDPGIALIKGICKGKSETEVAAVLTNNPF
ncbi:hypothetical protein MHK_007026 [Candidatus Magnetomorum sp. HK-1]|nr:hypothetical protein MHK_007026 [Candidatus Magnetomorum sp. HK-1]